MKGSKNYRDTQALFEIETLQSLLSAAMLFPIEFLFINKKYTFLTDSDLHRCLLYQPMSKVRFIIEKIKDICVIT